MGLVFVIKALVVSVRSLAVLPGRYARTDAFVLEAITQLVGIISLVSQEAMGEGKWRISPRAPRLSIIWSGKKIQGPALAVTEHAQLGVQAASRASNRQAGTIV